MVSPTNDVFPSHRPAPLAWKEFRRRSGFTTQPKVYVYDASPQIVPQSPPITTLSLSPVIGPPSLLVGLESPRKEHSGYLVSHVSQALQVLGSSTGGNIAEYIASNFSTELGIPYEKGRKLHYMVNAILSSPKYKYLFQKDQILKDEKRSLWRLKKPGDILDEETQMPAEMSLTSLIPPTSPCLSLKASRDDLTDPLAVPTASATSTPILKSSTSGSISPRAESFSGGSNEGEKHSGLSRSTEHAHAVPDTTSLAPLSPSSPCPSSPLGDTPSAHSLSARRKKRKNSGLDSSIGSESGSPKSPKQEEQGDEKKRRLDIAAA